ncbi:TNF receptor-associated factor 5 isoform X2 [Nematostella vectensis]|uniref:TNF receptor-associated factor 5 isoform X2 n=1 Tax=Nematostella vectensis TaxID=45351 RepID=UPI00139007AE|nr:TNF receptor-associated factor 5 isoform X2 [Nematostella vectensis]
MKQVQSCLHSTLLGEGTGFVGYLSELLQRQRYTRKRWNGCLKVSQLKSLWMTSSYMHKTSQKWMENCLMVLERSREQIFPDKKTDRIVLSLEVKCTNNPCRWKGELRQKQKHLKICSHKAVKCILEGCNVKVPRILMEKHTNTCGWRLLHCKPCNLSYPKKDEETVQHKDDCPLAFLPCRFSEIGCTFKGRESARDEHCESAVQTHLHIACETIRDNKEQISDLHKELDKVRQELQTKSCDHMKEVNAIREKHDEAIRDNKGQIEALSKEHGIASNTIHENKEQLDTLKKELGIASETIRKNRDQIAKLSTACKTQYTDGTFVWRICNYKDKYKKAVAFATNQEVKGGNSDSDDDISMAGDIMVSLPFYTSRYGYKMRLKAYPNGYGDGKGTHLSLSIRIMKGEYDAILEWPFRRKITLSLINQSEQWRSETVEIYPDDATPDKKHKFERPIENENVGCGYSCFISHMELNSGDYIKDDVIFIEAVIT